ncbi:hypothetical protein NODU109028_16080 [Nocardioides dubius]|uniref:hypothetical protein n=1 Tax=Nocardioides dubius TaxID=317019 RepID=UPI0031D7FFF0
MGAAPGSPEEFAACYQRHVDLVVAGDQAGVLADMAPGAVPAVFAGVDLPGAQVEAAEVVAVQVDGARAVGRARYRAPGREIGLESHWGYDGSAWKADGLANFDLAESGPA